MSSVSTVVFADLSGSTSLYESMGNERAAKTVMRLTQWIADVMQAHQGRVVKMLGDGVLGIFANAHQAVAAGLAFVPEDRKAQGLILHQTVAENLTCGNLDQLGKLCAVFVAQGLTFEANAEYLTITLTGGY